MSSKKPRPLFEVPTEIEPGRESGWVYRSNGREEPEPIRQRGSGGTTGGGSVMDTGSIALALSIAAVAQTMVLALTVAAIPMTIGVNALQSLARPEN
jgi:hypothetical protein